MLCNLTMIVWIIYAVERSTASKKSRVQSLTFIKSFSSPVT